MTMPDREYTVPIVEDQCWLFNRMVDVNAWSFGRGSLAKVVGPDPHSGDQ